VLDNCEHLIDACATLVSAILRSAPGVRVLATSREPLGIDGEAIWSLPLLTLPGDAGGLSPVDISVSESVQLFVERALAVKPSFRVTEQNAPAVVEIVRRLDGMPLALELAAARVKHMTVEQIAERLGNRFNLLSTGSRTALPRQQTLRALIDWGHDLLSDQERAAFRRLAVFSGGWTLAAAESVCAGDLVRGDHVLDLLSQLVDKSIVMVRERHGAARYSLLETMHQYALEKLHEAGDDALAAAHDAHAAYFAAYSEEAAPALATAARTTWLPRLDDESGNLRAALRWGQVSRDGGAIALRLSVALGWFWYHRGAWREGRGWLEGALLLPAAVSKSGARASALRSAGIAAWLQGNHRVATYRLEESVEISRSLKEERAVAGTLSILAQVVLNAGDGARARGIGEESVQRWRALGRGSAGLALALASLGNVAVAAGSYERAVELAEESASIFRKLGDDWAVSLPVRCLGMAALRTGDLEAAERNFREALELCIDSRDCWFLSRNVDGLASVAALAGDADRAARLLGAAERLREAVGTPVLPLHQSDRGRSTAVVRTVLSEEEFSAASSAGRELSIDEALSYARLAATKPTPVVVSDPRRMTPASSS
jgi:predicted ATPase